MKRYVILTALLGILIGLGCTSSSTDLTSGKIVDLTHSYDENAVFWPTAKEFHLEPVSAGMTEKGYYYTANNFSAAEHGGTHIDAPIHFNKNGKTLEALPLEQVIGKGVVIDVTEKCTADRDYQVQVEDFTAWEQKHGTQLNDVIVLLRTGFEKYWPDRIKYMGTDERGAEAVPKLHFPGLHPDAAKWLVENRTIKAIGLDT
ncbi:MAG: cyclase family protein, partial [bacterium]